MLEPLRQRTVIIGNSGSGKSTFADSLAALTHVPVIDLDSLHWEDDGYRIKREEEVAKRLVRDAAAAPRWIIEGVYGWLAEIALPRASALVWLDLPWSMCRESLILRSQQRGGKEVGFADLLRWAEAYWERQTPSSFTGHSRLFENFVGTKWKLRNREEVHELLVPLASGSIKRQT
jgi:adenylate kinase family enzyme